MPDDFYLKEKCRQNTNTLKFKHTHTHFRSHNRIKTVHKIIPALYSQKMKFSTGLIYSEAYGLTRIMGEDQNR